MSSHRRKFFRTLNDLDHLTLETLKGIVVFSGEVGVLSGNFKLILIVAQTPQNHTLTAFVVTICDILNL